MFEKMKSEYQAPADGKAMPSSPPQSPQPATNDDVLEEVDSSDLSSERHKTLAKKLSSIASKHSMRNSYAKANSPYSKDAEGRGFGKNDGVDGLAAQMELSSLADDVVADSDEIDAEIAQICLSLTDDDLRGVLSARNISRVRGKNF